MIIFHVLEIELFKSIVEPLPSSVETTADIMSILTKLARLHIPTLYSIAKTDLAVLKGAFANPCGDKGGKFVNVRNAAMYERHPTFVILSQVLCSCMFFHKAHWKTTGRLGKVFSGF